MGGPGGVHQRPVAPLGQKEVPHHAGHMLGGIPGRTANVLRQWILLVSGQCNLHKNFPFFLNHTIKFYIPFSAVHGHNIVFLASVSKITSNTTIEAN